MVTNLGPLPTCEYLSQPTTSDPPETFWSYTLSDDFPTLRRLATKYLSIPATDDDEFDDFCCCWLHSDC